MDLVTLYADNFQEIGWDQDHSLQVTTWLPSTKSMNYAHFKGCLLINAGFAEQQEARHVLVDGRAFRSQCLPMNNMWDWRSRESAPHYNRAGVEKFVFLFNEGAMLPPNNGTYQKNETFPTHYFDRLEDALLHLGVEA